MNSVLMICYNNLDLTKQAVESVLRQTIPIHLTFIDNGSTDDTAKWCKESLLPLPDVDVFTLPSNTQVAKVSNEYLRDIFQVHPHVLGVPNDVILHPTLYEEFLKWPRGMVTGSEIKDRSAYDEYVSRFILPTTAVSENTPMAVILVRRWAYEAIMARDGYFMDEGYFHYASDCDLALRMATCGIRGVQLSTPYWHYGSASHRLAVMDEAQKARVQADADRSYFLRKWGFKVDSLEYGKVANDPNFK